LFFNSKLNDRKLGFNNPLTYSMTLQCACFLYLSST